MHMRLPLIISLQWDMFEVPEYIERYQTFLSSLKVGDYMVFPGGTITAAQRIICNAYSCLSQGGERTLVATLSYM